MPRRLEEGGRGEANCYEPYLEERKKQSRFIISKRASAAATSLQARVRSNKGAGRGGGTREHRVRNITSSSESHETKAGQGVTHEMRTSTSLPASDVAGCVGKREKQTNKWDDIIAGQVQSTRHTRSGDYNRKHKDPGSG
jgi:hypothetical protein